MKGLFKSKKAQITLFVILGIILLVVVGVLILLFSSKSSENTKIKLLSGSSFEDQVSYLLFNCVDDAVKYEQTKFLDNGGFFDGDNPSNYIFVDNQRIITTYDRDFSSIIGFYPKEYYSADLQKNIENRLILCASKSNAQLAKRYDSYKVYLKDISSEILADGVVVKYKYSIETDKKLKTYKETKSFPFTINKYLEEANNITIEFVNALIKPDTYFNYQLCMSLKENKGFRPEYPVDIINIVKNKPGVKLLLAEDYFVVTLTDNKIPFKFAIKPRKVSPICK